MPFAFFTAEDAAGNDLLGKEISRVDRMVSGRLGDMILWADV